MSISKETNTSNFPDELKRGGAALPYSFRKNTGLISELNFIAGRTMQLVHETFSVAFVLKTGVETLREDTEKTDLLKQRVSQTSSGVELLSGELHPLHSIVTITLCAALEAGIEDTLIVALRFRPGMIEHLAQLGLKKLPAVVNRDLTYLEATHLHRKLEGRSRELKLAAPQGWLQQLSDVGLPISLSDSHSRALRELIYVRNCIVHRAHCADAECETEASFLKLRDGQKIRLTSTQMGIYVEAVQAVAHAVAGAAQAPAELNKIDRQRLTEK